MGKELKINQFLKTLHFLMKIHDFLNDFSYCSRIFLVNKKLFELEQKLVIKVEYEEMKM